MERKDDELEFFIFNKNHHKDICKLGLALASLDRINILCSLLTFPKSISELSNELAIPISSVSRHIEVLEEAKLISVYYQPGPKGRKKFSTQYKTRYIFTLAAPIVEEKKVPEFSVEMPIGLFSNCQIKEPCGMLSATGRLGVFDKPEIFFSPKRTEAELLWFSHGFISYNFPSYYLKHHDCSEISFSLEICSEVNYFNNNWPSDITFYINNIEILTYTSPGDFGGRRGKYTPSFWPTISSQFGLLKRITVNKSGIFLDTAFIDNHVTFDDLKLAEDNAVLFTIKIKDDAKHDGGLNIFGKNFGDHNQAIIMTIK